MTGQTINVADAYEHPLFHKEVDLKTGYRTRTLLAVPLRNLQGTSSESAKPSTKQRPVLGRGRRDSSNFGCHVSDTIETTQLDQRLENRPLENERNFHEDDAGGFSTQNIIGMSYRIQSIIRLIDQIRDCHGRLDRGRERHRQRIGSEGLAPAARVRTPFVAVVCRTAGQPCGGGTFGIEKGVATGVDRRIGKFEEANGGTYFWTRSAI